MATLPQAVDYGKRVQLRSGRVDVPGSGEMAVASALERAAGTFTKMAVEHKTKDDALSYASAKNEYMIADIQEREKLVDDQDFTTHDERYRTAMKGHYERLFPTVRAQRDRGLFDAEARLMDERGSVAVGNNARTKEIDFGIERFNGHAQTAHDIILATDDPQVAQDSMFGVLEEATALRDVGHMSPEQYKAVLQKWVQDTSFARLRSMDPEERAVLLERSITHRKTSGEPITQEQIRAGEGSGSIADFLNLDTAVAMLETTEKANEIELTLSAAQEVFDAAQGVNPTDTGAMMDNIREMTKDADPKVREQALVLGRQYRQDKQNEQSDDQRRVMTQGSEGIQNGIPPSQMNPDDLAILSGPQKAALDLEWERAAEGSKFGAHTVWTRAQQDDQKAGASYALWSSIPEEQRAYIDLEQPEWRMSFTQADHTDLVNEQKALKARLESGGGTLSGGLTNNQMVQSALQRSGFSPGIDREVGDYQAYQQLLFTMDRATQAEQERLGRNLSNTERNKILAEIMKPMAFTDSYIWWPDMDKDDMLPIAAMSVKQRKTARIPLREWASDIAYTSPSGLTASYKQELELMALRAGLEPDPDDYERAYFALKHGRQYDLGHDEVMSRLRGE